MPDERAPSRAELLEALRASRDEALAIVRAVAVVHVLGHARDIAGRGPR